MVSRSQAAKEGKLSVVRTSVLLIDDEAGSLFPTLAQNLDPLGFDLAKETNPARAVTVIQRSMPQLILLDLHFPGDERRSDRRTAGGELLTEIRRKFKLIPVIVFTTRLDDVDIPLERFNEQPHGYFAKPDFTGDPDWPKRLGQAMRNAIDSVVFAQSLDEENLGFLVGQTKEMQDVAARIRTAARNTLSVLIYGETGSGKRLAAEAIHKLSGRQGRFEYYNCAGADVDKLDCALFGYARGTLTSANETRLGLFELAENGTLFLDELQDIPMPLQSKLMTAIESGVFLSKGVKKDQRADVRLIFATNHNLSDLVADGLLREDLAFRLSASFISLPPLQRRMEDLPELFKIFVSKANAVTSRNVLPTLRPETRLVLEAHCWTGNIQELEATILRAVAQTNSNVVLPADIEFLNLARHGTEEASPATGSSPAALIASLTDHLESLDIHVRYNFVKNQGRDMQRGILEELTRRLRVRTGKRIDHKTLAATLDPLDDPDRDLNRIRQFLHACNLKLTQLECNR